MSREIKLPLPMPHLLGYDGLPARTLDGWSVGDVHIYASAYAVAAVEADRKGIVVTDDDVEDAVGRGVRGGLESFAKRLRGEA